MKTFFALACLIFGWLGPARPVAWADVLKPAPIRWSEWDVGLRAELQAMVMTRTAFSAGD